MTTESHHQGALIETARLELDRAHRAALTMEAGEVRRGLELALAALREAASAGTPDYEALAGRLATALSDLDSGSLAEMTHIIETARKEIGA